MEIVRIRPQGFCMGVARALAIARKTVQQNPGTPVYVLGMLVHNRFVVKDLEELGIITLDPSSASREQLIDRIPEGILIFTAHGTPQALIDRAKNKGLTVVDATCLDVLKTRKLIEERLSEGYEILYLGKKGHPEAEAMLSVDPAKIHLVSSLKDAQEIDLPQGSYALTSQTTLSMNDTMEMTEVLRSRFPGLRTEAEVCNATRKRQEAVLNAGSFDAFIVVGDPHSNNTTQLYRLALKNAPFACMVETAEKLDLERLKNCDRVAVTSGASTPDYLVNEVISTLQAL